MSSVLPPGVIPTINLNVVVWLLPIIVSKMHIVSQSTGPLVSSCTIHQVDTILCIADDTVPRITTHDEGLVVI